MNKRGGQKFLSNIVYFCKKKEPVSKALRKITIPNKTEEEVTYENGVPST